MDSKTSKNVLKHMASFLTEDEKEAIETTDGCNEKTRTLIKVGVHTDNNCDIKKNNHSKMQVES